jgi:dihydropteroate synthase
VLNITPDSFSDGGNFLSFDQAVDHAGLMIEEGADVIEIGGESTRPGAKPVSAADEIARVIPVITEIHRRWPDARLAIDTVKHEIAEASIAAGASIVNDVSALRLDADIARVCAERDCTLVLMHSRGDVGDMASYEHAEYSEDDVMASIIAELTPAVDKAVQEGVKSERIILDPGLGFSKRGEQSVKALAHLPRLLDLGFEVMVGASRKRFIGELTGVNEPADRVAGTIGANVVALTLGATWFRVHDVRENRQALDAAAGILGARS